MDGYISKIAFGPQVPYHTLNQEEANIINHCSANNIKITKMANKSVEPTPSSLVI